MTTNLLHPRWIVAVVVSLAVGALFIGVLLSSGGASAGEPDTSGQSATLFARMARVLQSPRCMNCHTRTDFPRQGDDGHRHTLNVARGPNDHGMAGLHCSTCHRSANQAASGVPGAPDWHLAPLRMAWEGLSVPELCRVLLDPARGGMRPEQFVPHLETGLVRWAWAPGSDGQERPRSPPALSHAEFIALTKQWLSTGAAGPNP